LAGVFPIQSETPEQVASRILNVAHYDLPTDYNDTYREKILAVGPEQVETMAKRYFSSCESRTPQRDADCSLDLVLVGNVKEFRDALKKEFPEATVEEIPFDQVNMLAADLRQPKEAAAPASPEALARGAQVVAAAAEATGGAALAKIESLAFIASGKLFTPQGEFPLDVRLQLVFPDRLWMDVNLPFGAIQQGYDGTSAWVASPQGTMDLPSNQTAQAQRGIDLVGGLGVYRQALTGKLAALFVGEEEVGGKKVLAVEWNAMAGKVKLYFDPETRLLVGARYRQTTLEGVFDTEQRWSDFRAVDGVRFPFHWVTYRDGAKFSEQTILEVKLNTKPDPSLFAKPTP